MDPANKTTSDEEEFDIAKEFNIILDSVPHSGIIRMYALKIALHRQQTAGVTCQIVEAHASET